MPFAITNSQSPSTELGNLLHKHPDKFQGFELSFGQAHVFYPEPCVTFFTSARSRTPASFVVDLMK